MAAAYGAMHKLVTQYTDAREQFIKTLSDTDKATLRAIEAEVIEVGLEMAKTVESVLPTKVKNIRKHIEKNDRARNQFLYATLELLTGR